MRKNLGRLSLVLGTLAVVCLSIGAAASAEAPYQTTWSRQLGTSNLDASQSVAVDGSGNAYISGYTNGSLGGPNAGSADSFLTKYDSAGSLLWSRQLGTSSEDYSRSVAVDGSGNAYISGYTNGSLGGPNAGNYDAFLTKYDSAGSLLWSRQVGSYHLDCLLLELASRFQNPSR